MVSGCHVVMRRTQEALPRLSREQHQQGSGDAERCSKKPEKHVELDYRVAYRLIPHDYGYRSSHHLKRHDMESQQTPHSNPVEYNIHAVCVHDVPLCSEQLLMQAGWSVDNRALRFAAAGTRLA